MLIKIIINQFKAVYVLCNTFLKPVSLSCLFCYSLIINNNFNALKVITYLLLVITLVTGLKNTIETLI